MIFEHGSAHVREKEHDMSIKLVSHHRNSASMLSLFVIVVTLMLSACTPEAASRWATIQEASEGQRATAQEALAGGEFNKFFPESRGAFEVVYTQEKIGFAEANLKEDGVDVATLAIFDTVSNPAAADKYTESSEELEGYPLVAVGSNTNAILVAERFQVQVRSRIDDFSEDDRKEWLAEFDLDGLAALK
jgi:hypothetical protein